MSEARRSRALSTRRGGRIRPSPAALGVVKVDSDFHDEYPDAVATSTESYASLCRTGDALLQEVERHIMETFGIPQHMATALAVLDGAGEALTPSQIGERVLVASATMTATLDALEDRGWLVRTPNPDDRRSVLIEITDEGRAMTDRLLPGIRKVEHNVMSALTAAERKQLLALLTKVLARAAEVAQDEPTQLDGRRVRPARLRA